MSSKSFLQSRPILVGIKWHFISGLRLLVMTIVMENEFRWSKIKISIYFWLYACNYKPLVTHHIARKTRSKLTHWRSIAEHTDRSEELGRGHEIPFFDHQEEKLKKRSLKISAVSYIIYIRSIYSFMIDVNTWEFFYFIWVRRKRL